MKLLFDQKISHRILQLLPDQLKDSSRVKIEGLINSPDRQIWDFAKLNSFTIVTQDSDFSDLNTLFGHPPKVIWIKSRESSNQYYS
jgi:predicted nuclease of predicted toxin-antitoxin system